MANPRQVSYPLHSSRSSINLAFSNEHNEHENSNEKIDTNAFADTCHFFKLGRISQEIPQFTLLYRLNIVECVIVFILTHCQCFDTCHWTRISCRNRRRFNELFFAIWARTSWCYLQVHLFYLRHITNWRYYEVHTSPSGFSTN
jgi:hypothetical protein